MYENTDIPPYTYRASSKHKAIAERRKKYVMAQKILSPVLNLRN